MNAPRIRWSLGSKLTLIGTPFFVLALLSTIATLWVSWQLDGGAAAVNEAGRMRMQAYRMALAVGTGESRELPALVKEFNQSLALLRDGDPGRPLFISWDDKLHGHFSAVEKDWMRLQSDWLNRKPDHVNNLRVDTVNFTAGIDRLVTSIETHLTHWTAILHMLQMGVLALAVLGTAVLLFSGYLFVLEPVGQLKLAIRKIQGGDLGTRVDRVTTDEFGTLAAGFNGMAEHLQSMYRNLEDKVLEKTAELEIKRERLESLYEVTALVARAISLDELAQDFSKQIMRVARADGVAIRWSDQANQRYLMLAAAGLPTTMVEEEHCLKADSCHCGTPTQGNDFKVIPIAQLNNSTLRHCEQAGFKTIFNVPIRLHERLLGEVDLFFHAKVTPDDAERSLLEAFNSHLASAMENLRLNALGKEAAVSEERQLLARELHDSIAQSLAFLKIQVTLMRDAVDSGSADEMRIVLQEIDTGVRECYGDVRELLMHFRTRANTEDIEPALATTLRKFEHQTGLTTTLAITGHGLPLDSDLQLQVLHIVQEALSNVRKHARASQVWLDVQQQPQWRFEVRDNGVGFAGDGTLMAETHVGLRIMRERAERINATLEVISTPRHGCSVILTLPPPARAQAMPAVSDAPVAVQA